METKLKYIPVALSIICAGLLTFVIVHGRHAVVLNPKGTVAFAERHLIIVATLAMLIVVVPVFILLFGFAWKYRASNTSAKYAPDWNHNIPLELLWWAIPFIIIFFLSIVIWNSSHDLDPYKPLSSNVPPITVQVIALDWKWLFIYPQQNVASVNLLEFPVGTPVNFQITSDAPMNSFWIPQLGGQIYAMPGMSTQLHLDATEIGNFAGYSANISGAGFSGMTFNAKSVSQQDFDSWVASIKQSSLALNMDEYNSLAQPSQNNPVAYYSPVDSQVFNNSMMKYMMPAMPGMSAMSGMGNSQ